MLMFNLSCKSQSNLNNNISIIDVSNFEQGKINLPYNQIDYLSKVLKINKKHLTTSLYYREGTKVVGIPINDKKFNYKYFQNFNYDSKIKAKLYVQKYIYENKEYFVAVRIE